MIVSLTSEYYETISASNNITSYSFGHRKHPSNFHRVRDNKLPTHRITHRWCTHQTHLVSNPCHSPHSLHHPVHRSYQSYNWKKNIHKTPLQKTINSPLIFTKQFKQQTLLRVREHKTTGCNNNTSRKYHLGYRTDTCKTLLRNL